MALKSINKKFTDLAGSIGRGALSVLFPKDFEAYIMGLELTDSNDNTIDYFAFPILPESITKTEPKRSNIKKTSTGITVLSSNSFVPEEITMKGNFGKTFRFYLSPASPSVQGVAFSTISGKYDLLSTKSRIAFGVAPKFSVGVKTGFGAHSILRAIISKSNGTDYSGRPFKLYFYNMALGESYLVTVPPSGFTSTQTMNKNMIWEYTLNLTVIAPLSALTGSIKKFSMLKLLMFSAIQNGVTTASASVSSILKK